jgi:hypothetical protein
VVKKTMIICALPGLAVYSKGEEVQLGRERRQIVNK